MSLRNRHWVCPQCKKTGFGPVGVYCSMACKSDARLAAAKQLETHQFGDWQVVAVDRIEDRGFYAQCVCVCGKRAAMPIFKLTSGRSKGCGCTAANLRRIAQTKHGLYGTPTYESWKAMKARCTQKNPDFKFYRQRGTKVCERWQEFENFLADMGERPEGTTLDRIDNNGHYEPGNCRWATPEEQQGNKSNCVRIRLETGEVVHVAEAIRRTGISRNRYKRLIERGAIEVVANG